jgi:hypothetical protein
LLLLARLPAACPPPSPPSHVWVFLVYLPAFLCCCCPSTVRGLAPKYVHLGGPGQFYCDACNVTPGMLVRHATLVAFHDLVAGDMQCESRMSATLPASLPQAAPLTSGASLGCRLERVHQAICLAGGAAHRAVTAILGAFCTQLCQPWMCTTIPKPSTAEVLKVEGTYTRAPRVPWESLACHSQQERGVRGCWLHAGTHVGQACARATTLTGDHLPALASAGAVSEDAAPTQFTHWQRAHAQGRPMAQPEALRPW